MRLFSTPKSCAAHFCMCFHASAFFVRTSKNNFFHTELLVV